MTRRHVPEAPRLRSPVSAALPLDVVDTGDGGVFVFQEA